MRQGKRPFFTCPHFFLSAVKLAPSLGFSRRRGKLSLFVPAHSVSAVPALISL
jgi:hypothetical protein